MNTRSYAPPIRTAPRAHSWRAASLALFAIISGCATTNEPPGSDAANRDSASSSDLDHASDGSSAGEAAYLPVVCEAVATPACDSVAHELPVPSHFSTASLGFSFMATGEADVFMPAGLPADYQMGGCYPVYRRGMMPSVDNYVADRYSGIAIPDAEAQTWATAVCNSTGVPLRHVFPPRADGSQVAQGPISRACVTQVVHGVLAGDSVYTVFLPPDWDAAAPAGTYPILFNGHYDLNTNVFREAGSLFARLVTKSGVAGGRGVIGVLWNGGGAYASRTMSSHAADLAAAVIEEVAARYRGNRRWVVTMGGSRGGGTALTIAANLGAHPYRTVAAIALVPPALIGEHAQLGSVTYPGLLHAAGWSTGLQDAWRAGWSYPACAGHPELTGLLGWQAHLKVLTGTSDPEVANNEHSLLGAASMAALTASGTQIYLSVGEHDEIVPYAHQVRLGLALVERALPAQIEVLVRGGHSSIRTRLGGEASAYELHERVLEKVIATLAAPDLDLAGPVPPLVTKGLRFHRVDRVSGQTEVFTPSAGYPFSVDLPYFAVAGQRFPMVAVGEPGTSYTLTAVYLPSGAEAGSFTGTIPASMTSTTWVDLPVDQPLGKYSWTARLVRAGGSIVDIPATATPTGTACTTEVLATEPAIDYSAVYVASKSPALSGYANTNWGLSEY